jgi:hypothetical protein
MNGAEGEKIRTSDGAERLEDGTGMEPREGRMGHGWELREGRMGQGWS